MGNINGSWHIRSLTKWGGLKKGLRRGKTKTRISNCEYFYCSHKWSSSLDTFSKDSSTVEFRTFIFILQSQIPIFISRIILDTVSFSQFSHNNTTFNSCYGTFISVVVYELQGASNVKVRFDVPSGQGLWAVEVESTEAGFLRASTNCKDPHKWIWQ